MLCYGYGYVWKAATHNCNCASFFWLDLNRQPERNEILEALQNKTERYDRCRFRSDIGTVWRLAGHCSEPKAKGGLLGSPCVTLVPNPNPNWNRSYPNPGFLIAPSSSSSSSLPASFLFSHKTHRRLFIFMDVSRRPPSFSAGTISVVPARVFAGTSRVFVKQIVDVMTTPTTHLGASAASSKLNDADLAAHGAPSSSNKKKSLALTLRSGRTMPLRRFQMVGVVVDVKKNSNTASLDDGTGVVKVAFEQKAGTAAAGTLASLRVGEVIVVHCSEAQVVASKKRRSNSDAPEAPYVAARAVRVLKVDASAEMANWLIALDAQTAPPRGL